MQSLGQIDQGMYWLDILEQGRECRTSSYLVVGDQAAVIETGPTTSVPRLLEGLREVGFDPQDLDYLMVTHVHLDHAGGVGFLARELPRTKVVVHPRGARHLINPEKLVNSARLVWGPDMDLMFGPMVPVPPERIVTPEDGAVIELGGGRALQALHTPGHAGHHLCFFEPASGSVFTGDVAGVDYPLIGPLGYARPAAPLPDFDRRLMKDSIMRLAGLPVSRVCFSHFGPREPGMAALERALGQLEAWEELIGTTLRKGGDREEVVATLLPYELKRVGLPPNAGLEELGGELVALIEGFINDLQQRP